MEGRDSGIAPEYASVTALMRATGFSDRYRQETPEAAQQAHLQGLSALWFYQQHAIYELIAEIKNMMGGKRPPKNPSSDPPMRPEELFTGLEIMAHRAPYTLNPWSLSQLHPNQLRSLPQELLDAIGVKIPGLERLNLSPEAAQAIIEAYDQGFILGAANLAYHELYPRLQLTAKKKGGKNG